MLKISKHIRFLVNFENQKNRKNRLKIIDFSDSSGNRLNRFFRFDSQPYDIIDHSNIVKPNELKLKDNINIIQFRKKL